MMLMSICCSTRTLRLDKRCENRAISPAITNFHFSSLTEKIVSVLPQMKCPFAIEPHQIQGLDFINIFPVVQWLIKESVNKRNEKAARLKVFASGQFHNHFKLSSSEQSRIERIEVLRAVQRIEDLFAAKRQFKRKQNVEPEDERSRVRLTLLEYGIRSIARTTNKATSDGKFEKTLSMDKDPLSGAEMEQDEVRCFACRKCLLCLYFCMMRFLDFAN